MKRFTGLVLFWLTVWAALSASATTASANRTDLLTREAPPFQFEYAPGQATLVERLAEKGPAHAARIYAELGGEVPEARGLILVTLLENEETMLDEAQARHGSRPPEWAAGLAYPSKRVIFLHAAAPPRDIDQTFQHEISHVALRDVVGQARLPLWFIEGVAVRQSEGFDFERARILTQAAIGDALLNLEDINQRFPKVSTRAALAYAQAVHLVGFLYTQWGEGTFRELLARLAGNQGEFSDAVTATYPYAFTEIEARWRKSLEVWWGWVPLVFGGATLWVLATVLMVMAFRRRRRQQQARIEAMAGEEAMDMAEDIEIAHGLQPPPDLHDPYEGRPPTIH